MKKRSFYVIGFLMMFFTIFLENTVVNAHEEETQTGNFALYYEDIEDHTVLDLTKPSRLPRYIACDRGGKHTLRAAGKGDVYNVKQKKFTIRNGFSNRCSKCGMVIVSVENPNFYWVTKLGYYMTGYGYAANSPYYQIQTNYGLSYNGKLGGDGFTQGCTFMDRIR